MENNNFFSPQTNNMNLQDDENNILEIQNQSPDKKLNLFDIKKVKDNDSRKNSFSKNLYVEIKNEEKANSINLSPLKEKKDEKEEKEKTNEIKTNQEPKKKVFKNFSIETININISNNIEITKKETEYLQEINSKKNDDTTEDDLFIEQNLEKQSSSKEEKKINNIEIQNEKNLIENPINNTIINLKENNNNNSITEILIEKKEKEEINSISKENSKEKESQISSSKKMRKPRRSKEIMDGRTFICPICKKAYLSRPALHNHEKLKHSPNDFKSLPISFSESKKFNQSAKRGRPQKSSSDVMNNIKEFFKDEKRRNSNFVEEDDKNFHFDDNDNNPFQRFLIFVKPRINDNYFQFVKYYIMLYNEFYEKNIKESNGIKINNNLSNNKIIIQADDNDLNNTNIIQIDNSNIIDNKNLIETHEQIPDLVNDYFRYIQSRYTISDIDLKFELVEMIYVFCLWLKEKGFTSATLEYINHQ